MSLRRALLPLATAITMTTANAHEFAQGQVWSYKTRPSESGSTILINLVETDPKLGRIFHISVRAVRLKNPQVVGGVSTELPHFPVSQKTLEESVVALRGTEAPNPEYREGYALWRRAFDGGHAGVFTIPVAEIVKFVEEAMKK